MDSGGALVRKKAMTQPQLEHIKDHIKCLDKSKFSSAIAPDLIRIMQKASNYFDQGEMEGVGEAFAEMNLKLCGEKVLSMD